MTITELAPRRAEAASWPFAQVRRIGNTVYVGLQVLPGQHGADPSPIEDQTHYVFRSLIESLEREGAKMSDLTKLHTYYLYQGEGRDVTDYWERMTAVRLQYLANPGPAATALRISSLWPTGPAIGVDGIAELGVEKKRIMPEHAWDWSIPTPFSQGWLVGNKVYVGGQISADRQGKAIAAGDVKAQTKITLEYIHHVLLDAGSSWQDVVSLKIAFKHNGKEVESRDLLNAIVDEVGRAIPGKKPVLIPFGVDLLYEGLVLEIDAVAVKDVAKTPIRPAGYETWKETDDKFEVAWQAGSEIYIGGIGAPGGASLAAQVEGAMARIGEILQAASADYADLAKVNVYFTTEAGRPDAQADAKLIVETLENFLAAKQTVVSIVQVPGLARPGQRVQIDGVAVQQ